MLFLNDPYFQLIKNKYSNKKATRSGVPYINHIVEGLIVLQLIGATDNAKRAYCLHPLTQCDAELVKTAADNSLSQGDFWPWVLAIEYRHIANGYLSTRKIGFSSHLEQEVKLSPLKDVNDMLIADKVQNRADFELYHLTGHPRSDELDVYFKNWLRRLGVSEEQYKNLSQQMKSTKVL